jgi:hypothetical protein
MGHLAESVYEKKEVAFEKRSECDADTFLCEAALTCNPCDA